MIKELSPTLRLQEEKSNLCSKGHCDDLFWNIFTAICLSVSNIVVELELYEWHLYHHNPKICAVLDIVMDWNLHLIQTNFKQLLYRPSMNLQEMTDNLCIGCTSPSAIIRCSKMEQKHWQTCVHSKQKACFLLTGSWVFHTVVTHSCWSLAGAVVTAPTVALGPKATKSKGDFNHFSILSPAAAISTSMKFSMEISTYNCPQPTSSSNCPHHRSLKPY